MVVAVIVVVVVVAQVWGRLCLGDGEMREGRGVDGILMMLPAVSSLARMLELLLFDMVLKGGGGKVRQSRRELQSRIGHWLIRRHLQLILRGDGHLGHYAGSLLNRTIQVLHRRSRQGWIDRHVGIGHRAVAATRKSC